MLSFEIVTTFFLASALLALAPGPDILFVLAQSLAWGTRSGLLIIAGLCTGLVFHTLAVALGVAVIVQSSPILFNAIKVVGALYLLYLAWQAWNAGASNAKSSAGAMDSIALYRRGVIMNLTNPKVLIFFLALLPQFANPEAGNVAVQVVLLGLVFMTAAAMVFGTVAVLAGSVGKWLGGSAERQCYLNRMAAVVFVLLALNVFFLV